MDAASCTACVFKASPARKQGGFFSLYRGKRASANREMICGKKEKGWQKKMGRFFCLPKALFVPGEVVCSAHGGKNLPPQAKKSTKIHFVSCRNPAGGIGLILTMILCFGKRAYSSVHPETHFPAER